MYKGDLDHLQKDITGEKGSLEITDLINEL